MSAILDPSAVADDNSIGAGGVKLSNGQQAGLDQFMSWYLNPDDPIFVLEGYSGTGKTTLVRTIMERLPKLRDMMKLLDSKAKPYEMVLTATTNQAAENFSDIMGLPCETVHRALGLTVMTDWTTRETFLVSKGNQRPLENTLLVVDEGSYIDAKLLAKILEGVNLATSKIMFIGDPAQLLQVRCFKAPVFHAGFTTAKLTEIMRQAEGNPIIELSTKFRKAVETGEWFNFQPDGQIIRHLPRHEFDQEIINEFTRPDWTFLDSKFLAWTNKRVIAYNHAINNCAKGQPEFKKGDMAVNNKYINNRKFKINTDQMVQITDISPPITRHGVLGNDFTVDGAYTFFMPKSREDWHAAVAHWKKQGNYSMLETIEREWIDLRAAYAQTINKSQGRTYGQVFIDLDDVRRCNSGDQIARMLYVGTSRAKHRVTFTGDLA